ncbi:MAG TPA: acylphosphatase [Deltaproteobacteria bacterium]|nr:acylphosphatase [Deltaproteobacteria bacterium]
MKAALLTIHGRVQGVWFRASTQEKAIEHGVTGWVRNTSDGSVEAHVQGEDAAVEKLILWCHTGPSGARVEQVEIRPSLVEPDLTTFTIRG